MEARKTNHLAWILFLSALLFAPFLVRLLGGDSRPRRRRNYYLISTMRNMACAVEMYMVNNRGWYPLSLSCLDIDDPAITSRFADQIDLSGSQEQWGGTYHYLVGGLNAMALRESARDFPVIIYPEEVDNEVHHYVLFADGAVRLLWEEEFFGREARY